MATKQFWSSEDEATRNLPHQVEDTSVVVLLEELVLALGSFVGDNPRVGLQLSSPLLLCHVVHPLNVLPLLLLPGRPGEIQLTPAILHICAHHCLNLHRLFTVLIMGGGDHRYTYSPTVRVCYSRHMPVLNSLPSLLGQFQEVG